MATDNAIARKLHEIAQDLSNFHLEGPDGNTDFSGHRLKPGESRNLGPVAGTGAPIPGIGSADLGEVIEIPDGKGGKKLVAVFGDSFSTDHVPRPGEAADHYKSVAVEIKGFDQNGKPIWGDALTGYDGENGRPRCSRQQGFRRQLRTRTPSCGKHRYERRDYLHDGRGYE